MTRSPLALVLLAVTVAGEAGCPEPDPGSDCIEPWVVVATAWDPEDITQPWSMDDALEDGDLVYTGLGPVYGMLALLGVGVGDTDIELLEESTLEIWLRDDAGEAFMGMSLAASGLFEEDGEGLLRTPIIRVPGGEIFEQRPGVLDLCVADPAAECVGGRLRLFVTLGG